MPEKQGLGGCALVAVTSSQAELVATIRNLHDATGVWPSGLAIARAARVNRSAIARRLHRLVRIGVLLWAGGDVQIARDPDGLILSLAEARA